MRRLPRPAAAALAAALAIAWAPGAPTRGPTSTASPGSLGVARAAVDAAGPVVSDMPAGDGGGAPDLPRRYRTPVCATGYRNVAVYAVAADRPGRYAAVAPYVRWAVYRANAFLYTEGREAGASRMDFRFACSGGRVAVRAARLRTPAQLTSFGTIEHDLRALGFSSDRAKYWVWYDGAVAGSPCGQARVPPGELLRADHPANRGPDVAVVYAEAPGCGSEAHTLLHEAMHTMGAVATGAPHGDGGGHCVDGLDVICSSAVRCRTLQLDCGSDTYFDPWPERGEYLDRHWNLALCVNRFIERSGCVSAVRDVKARVSGLAVRLTWRRPAVRGGRPIVRYEIWRSTCPSCRLVLLDAVPGSRLEYRDPGLDTLFAARYRYRVRAVNAWADAGPLSRAVAPRLV